MGKDIFQGTSGFSILDVWDDIVPPFPQSGVLYVHEGGFGIQKKEVMKIILELPLVMIIQQVMIEVVGFLLQLNKERKTKASLKQK